MSAKKIVNTDTREALSMREKAIKEKEANVETYIGNQKGGLSATAIKMIAVVCMFIDHIAAFILARLISSGIWQTETVLFSIGETNYRLEYVIYMVMRLIGRVSFPIFTYFLVEGFFKTRNRWKYFGRLCLFAVISEAPFSLAMYGLSGTALDYICPRNVFFTLAIGLAVIAIIDMVKNIEQDKYIAVCFRILAVTLPTAYVAYEAESILLFDAEDASGFTSLFWIVWIALVVTAIVGLTIIDKKVSRKKAREISCILTTVTVGAFIAELFETDYAGAGVLVIFVMYLFAQSRNRWVGTTIGYVILILKSSFEITALADIFILNKYNGKRGKGYKYFFYIFYPAHLAIIVLVCYITSLI